MAAHGGGAWKVAYADFVTAMMAFFLVMWICGQDQKIRRSVSDYFSDPTGTEGSSTPRKPTRTGALAESITTGPVPAEEKVNTGRGRLSFTRNRLNSPPTKLVSEWLHQDEEIQRYWRKQALHQREAARWAKEVRDEKKTIDQVAIRQLMLQLEEEFAWEVSKKTQGIHRSLLERSMLDVNWEELAQDLIAH